MEIFKPMVSAAMQNAFVNGQPQQQQQQAIQQPPWQQQQWQPRGQRGFNGSYGNGQQRPTPPTTAAPALACGLASTLGV